MIDPTVSKIYARSLSMLGEKDSVEITKEVEEFQKVVLGSNALESLLYLDIFTAEEKKSVIDDIFSKTSYSALLKNFMQFLIEEKRIHLFPFIYRELVLIEDRKNGVIKGEIQGVQENISSEEEQTISNYLKKKIGREPSLKYVQNKNLTAGFSIRAEDLQLDATIDRQFEIFKNSVFGEQEI